MTGKKYLENPYLKNLTSEILEKEKKGNRYHIVLDKTIFIPRLKDGVKIDKGHINGIQVLDVFIEDEKIVHVVADDISDTEVCIEIDWNTRFDYMQQHTGEHIIRASIDKLCEAKITRVKIDDEYSYIYLDCINLNEMYIDSIENFANCMIYSNFKIISRNTEDKDTKKIFIDNMHTIICDSIHCSNTGEVGIIKIIDFKRDDDGKIELKFVCGSRALKDYSLKNDIIVKLTKMLSVNEVDLISELENRLDIDMD